jgi:hypothetical protein
MIACRVLRANLHINFVYNLWLSKVHMIHQRRTLNKKISSIHRLTRQLGVAYSQTDFIRDVYTGIYIGVGVLVLLKLTV